MLVTAVKRGWRWWVVCGSAQIVGGWSEGLGWRGGGDSVPEPLCGVDDWWFFEFASESGDHGFVGVGERVCVLVPCLVEQSVCSESTGACCEQRVEDRAFFGGELMGWLSR
jgi:hypothetical protein